MQEVMGVNLMALAMPDPARYPHDFQSRLIWWGLKLDLQEGEKNVTGPLHWVYLYGCLCVYYCESMLNLRCRNSGFFFLMGFPARLEM